MMRTMGKTGEGTLAWLRERNRQRVLGALRERGPTSQADIARATGLSRTTVSKLVGELKVSGVVDSRGSPPCFAGRSRWQAFAAAGVA